MRTVTASRLKNHLGEALEFATLDPVAIERHGRVVAYLIPPGDAHAPTTSRQRKWQRRDEERAVELCARADFRLSRWARAGDARTLAGIAVVLASLAGFDRIRMLSLAERLWPGMTTPLEFGRWLADTPLQSDRFVPMLEARLRESSTPFSAPAAAG